MKSALKTLLILTVSGQLHATSLEHPAARDVIVKFYEVPERLDAIELAAADDVERIVRTFPVTTRQTGLSKIVTITAKSRGGAENILRSLEVDSRVEWAELRAIRYADRLESVQEREGRLDSPPNDPFFSQQWWMNQIEAPSAWHVVSADSTALIAIVDDGVYFGLPDLQAARWNNLAELNGISGLDDDGNGFTDDFHGYDFLQFDGDPTPDPLDGYNSHGTHVAGIAVATRNDRIGIAGVASGAKVIGVRVGQGGTIPYGFEGVYYACVAGARVINCSWGGGTESALEREVVSYVRSQGCVVVCSAGNNGNSLPRYPAAIEGVLSVAATTEANTAAAFTNYGPWIKIAAPGVHIVSTVVDGTYGAWQGTSMSAPIVSAVCALVLQQNPDWTSDQIVTAVCNSADPIGTVNDSLAGNLGLGRVNAFRAVSTVEESRGVRLSGVRFHETIGDGDNRIEAGEQAFLDVEVANEHGELWGLTGTATSQWDSIQVWPTELIYPGVVDQGFWWSDFAEPRIRMPDVIERGAILPLQLEWRAGNHVVGRATTTIFLDTTFAEIETEDLRFALGEQGALGYFDYVRSIPVGPGLALKNELSNALFHGSVFVAADGKVIDNYRGDSTGKRFDWSALPDVYAAQSETPIAPTAIHSRFDDRRVPEDERLGAEVSATVLSWPDVPRGYAIELLVVNRSTREWHQGVCGLMMDWDLGPASRNSGEFLADGGVLCVRSDIPSLPHVGMAGITESLTTAYEIGNREEFQMGGMTQSRAWQIVNAGVGGFASSPRDLSHIAGIAMPSLLPGDSVLKRFAILVGETPAELTTILESIRQKLGFHWHGKEPALDKVLAKKPTVTPNPVRKGQKIEISQLERGTAAFQLYNILGQEIARYTMIVGDNGRFVLPELPPAASGLLFYRLDHSGGQFSGKLLLLP